MIFKQQKRSDDFVIILAGNEHDTPAPEVGKVYKAFDDGKIRWSRLDYWRIDEAIDLDAEGVDQELIDYIAKEIDTCYWLYSPEQHIIYKATMVNKDGSPWLWKDDTEPTECYFLRTKAKEWFGTGFLIAGLLDTDDYYFNKYLKDED